MLQSENIADLSAALAKAQASMKTAVFNRTNPFFKNKYADLSAVIEAVRKPLTDNDISFTQAPEMRDGAFVLVTALRHSTGQWIAAEYPLPMNAKPQEIGSAITYARRYSLSCITGLDTGEDDDAEAARKGNGKAQPTGEVIMSDQVEALQKMLKTKPIINEKSFCTYLGLSDLSDMSASRYNEAVAAIIEKRKVMEGAA